MRAIPISSVIMYSIIKHISMVLAVFFSYFIKKYILSKLGENFSRCILALPLNLHLYSAHAWVPQGIHTIHRLTMILHSVGWQVKLNRIEATHPLKWAFVVICATEVAKVFFSLQTY